MSAPSTLLAIWGLVAVGWAARAIARRAGRDARFTLWDDDPHHPTGQNDTDRAVNGCLNGVGTLALLGVVILAVVATIQAMAH